MNESYKIICVNRHILINDHQNGLVVIDTGSPVSFHKNGHIVLCGQEYTVNSSYMGTDSAYISQKVGVDISGLIGMDIISQYDIWIDTMKGDGTIDFYDNDFTSMWSVETFSIFGCPGIIMIINGQRSRMLFDTAAPISYVKESFINGLPICGHAMDFTPLTQNEYEVDLYSLNANFASKQFDIKIAKSPIFIAQLLEQLNVDGIIGYDLIDNFRIILNKGKVIVPPQGI